MRLNFKCCLVMMWALVCGWPCIGQHRKVSLRDSLDKAFDLSDYIIEMHGFVPVPMIITEPSLGGFGGALVPVVLRKRPPIVDTVQARVKVSPLPPDITGLMGGYTVNDSWFAGAFRAGTFAKPKIKYAGGAMYGDINMSYFRETSGGNEKEFMFNIRTAAALFQATKRIGHSRWYGGFKYMFADSEVKYRADTIMPDFVKPLEISSMLSQLGAIVEYDSRDNIFTPDNGIKIHVDGICSNNVLGSDFNFWRMNYYAYLYKTLFRKYTLGLRVDGQQTFDDPPFYMLPFLDMRGLPASRYQGKADLLSELELRWDVYKRWSVMLYSGAGKAFDKWSEWKSSDWVVSYGTGFRYLLARKFKLRTGIDVARGPEKWAYYIVFGSNWLK